MTEEKGTTSLAEAAEITGGLESKSERGGRAVTLTVANKLFTLLINVGTGVLTARTLMPRGRGELAALILWPPFLTNITTLGIPSAMIFVLRRKPSATAESAATGFLITSVLGIAAALLGALWLPFWLDHQYDRQLIHEAQWLLVVTPIIAIGQTGRCILEAKGLFSQSNWILLLNPATTLVFLLALLLSHQLTPFTGGLAYMAGTVPAFYLMLRWVLPLMGRGLLVSQNAAKALLSYGVRSFGIDLLGTLALQVDQVLVISLLSPSSMGIYGAMLSLSRMFNIFQGSVVMVLFPKATGQSAEKVIELTEQSARISTSITALCCLMVSLLGEFVLRLLYGAAYAKSPGCLQMLLAEVTISGSVFILSQAFMALGRPGVVTILQAIGLSTSVPLMLWLIPRFGVNGAALSLLISTIVRFLLVFIAFRFVLKSRTPRLLPTLEDLGILSSTFKGALSRV